jgi:hypothetical protein
MRSGPHKKLIVIKKMITTIYEPISKQAYKTTNEQKPTNQEQIHKILSSCDRTS